MLTLMDVARVLALFKAVHWSQLKASSIKSAGTEAARLAMALLLLAFVESSWRRSRIRSNGKIF